MPEIIKKYICLECEKIHDSYDDALTCEGKHIIEKEPVFTITKKDLNGIDLDFSKITNWDLVNLIKEKMEKLEEDNRKYGGLNLCKNKFFSKKAHTCLKCVTRGVEERS
ncbi:MAG: hypothetical protein AABY07_01285 [Nanoarchaeota archaeon]|mgnify:CR=1 FL=1